jgi:lipopolysaccharide/colanic/teichoic acid biosynthesis glycosyltransferase
MEQGLHLTEVYDSTMTTAVEIDAEGLGTAVVEMPRHTGVTRADSGEMPHFDAATFSAAQPSRVVEFFIRLLDIVGSVTILLLSLPAMAVVAVLIKLTSPGPILYRQERVGKNGRLFSLCKFRTMVDDAEKHVGPVWAARDDQRVTPVGRVLRRMRLDELPQLYNILRGDMSLVGPRPERPFFVQRHKALQGTRLAVRPGLTGLAQIRSFYDLKPTHKVRYDYIYIQKRSFLLNLYILLQTVPVLFTKKGW